MVPLLQISPSKTDRERVMPADPDLVAVLARILRRIKDPDGHVPLLSRYDCHERSFGPPLPHLFQRPYQHRLDVISPARVRRMLADLAIRAAIVDVDGTPLRFTPHDFRRIFATETVNSGLPIHIAAKLLGHLDLTTTQLYVAVYPQDVIRHYRRFLTRRRALRPSEEYREPTDAEWEEFQTTSASARSNWAPAAAPTAPPASTNTPASAAPCSAPTPPSCHDWPRSRSTPGNGSRKPTRCSGSARSPACRTACATSPTRSSKPNASNNSRTTPTATTTPSDDHPVKHNKP